MKVRCSDVTEIMKMVSVMEEMVKDRTEWRPETSDAGLAATVELVSPQHEQRTWQHL